MKVSEFTEILDRSNHNYTISGNNTSITSGGGVGLNSLTSLPEGTEFKNGGSVYLNSLTSLPEGTEFKNSGGVYLNSLKGKGELYKSLTVEVVDGCTMLVRSTRNVGDFMADHCWYMGGGPVEKLSSCFVATKGEQSAHGDSIREAIRDVEFKVLQLNFNTDDLVAKIKERGTIKFNDYRLLTGACESGLRHGIEEAGVTEEVSVSQIVEISKGRFGGEIIEELFA